MAPLFILEYSFEHTTLSPSYRMLWQRLDKGTFPFRDIKNNNLSHNNSFGMPIDFSLPSVVKLFVGHAGIFKKSKFVSGSR